MKVNWKVRVKHLNFWIGLFGVATSPILAYLGLGYADMTDWGKVTDVLTQFFTNPYLIGTVCVAVLSFIGVLTDPTTKGVSDSEQAIEYNEPK